MDLRPQPRKPGTKGARMAGMRSAGIRSCQRAVLAPALLLAVAVPCVGAPTGPAACTRIDLTGKVSAGQEWKAPLGEGWVFRVVPIAPGAAGYTGWDLVVDRDPPTGYPDALLLATPPYNSINEREIGTTYGLRAQDAVGWNPRSFRFLTDPAALREGQKLYLDLASRLRAQSGAAAGASSDPAIARLTRQLMAMQANAAAGEFRILDAGFAPGTADPAPFAENWALQSARRPYTLMAPSGGKPTPRGELEWMRFSATLWLPAGWKAPHGLGAISAPCGQ